MMAILDTLKALDESRGAEIERWFAERRKEALPFFTTSVDLRHSGLRLVPVDTNLYPAGFNNLSAAAKARASRFIASFLQERHAQAERVLIVPENHTRNLGYLENLATLLALFEQTGMKVRIGNLSALPGEPMMLETPSGQTLTEYPLQREGRKLRLEDGFTPDLILLNNDMTAGMPQLLEALDQPVLPPANMGWWQRRKSIHFDAYRDLSQRFCKTFGLDPWLLCAGFQRCGMVDFKETAGIDRLARNVEALLKAMQRKYDEYGVKEAPYVYVKADSGTYGMGIMTVRAAEDVLEMNKKARNKMHVIKEGARVSEVIIQEGIPTVDEVDGKPAEPMVYMIDGIPVGGMYRVNGARDAYGNLNAAGMEFTGMCDETEKTAQGWQSVKECHFRSYGIVAALAALAAAREDYSIGKHGEGI